MENPVEANHINIEEEKEDISENLTAGDINSKQGNPKDSFVGQIKRKTAPNGDNGGKKKKSNIVESLSQSLNKERERNFVLTEDIEEVVEDQSTTSICIEKFPNTSEVSDKFAPKEDGEEDIEEFNQGRDEFSAEDGGEDEDDGMNKEKSPVSGSSEIDDIPAGWCRKEVKKAFSNNKLIVIVQAPDGRQFDSQMKLNSYLARNKLQHKISLDGPIEKKITLKDISHSFKPKTDSSPVKQTEAKKKVKPKKEETAVTDRSLTNEDIDGDCDKEFCYEDRLYIEDIDMFMKEKTDLNLRAFPLTGRDGNCWFRAISDQVVIQNIPDKAKNHRALRLEVCDYVKMLPEDILERTITIVFKGKKRGLNELVARQRKAGQWVDDGGIMVMLTAQYLGRNIHLYSYPRETPDNTWPYSLTKIEAGPGAEKYPPVTVFFYDKHYQTLQPDPDSPNEGEDNKNQ